MGMEIKTLSDDQLRGMASVYSQMTGETFFNRSTYNFQTVEEEIVAPRGGARLDGHRVKTGSKRERIGFNA